MAHASGRIASSCVGRINHVRLYVMYVRTAGRSAAKDEMGGDIHVPYATKGDVLGQKHFSTLVLSQRDARLFRDCRFTHNPHSARRIFRRSYFLF